jgi:hypothetical protein
MHGVVCSAAPRLLETLGQSTEYAIQWGFINPLINPSKVETGYGREGQVQCRGRWVGLGVKEPTAGIDGVGWGGRCLPFQRVWGVAGNRS